MTIESGSAPLSNRKREQEMAETILSYLNEHAEASDTLEGIAEWWIRRERIRVEVDSLRKVLGQLTQNGLLERIGAGENAVYRLKAGARSSSHW